MIVPAGPSSGAPNLHACPSPFLREPLDAPGFGRDLDLGASRPEITTMSGTPTFPGLTRDTLEEHRQIHFYLDQIEQTLEALTPELGSSEPLRRLAAQIGGLRERMAEHHQAEEQGGLFQALVEAFPTSRSEVERLTREHGRMIEILEMARLHALHGRPEEAAELREDIAHFLDTFRKHERDEERLIARAFDRD
jgi:hemerythrin-like domain-containing protein